MPDVLLVALVFAGLVALVIYRDALGALWRPALGALIFIGGLTVGRFTARRGSGSPEPIDDEPARPLPGTLAGVHLDDDLDDYSAPPPSNPDVSNDDLGAWLDANARKRE